MEHLPNWNLDPPEVDASFTCECCDEYNDVTLGYWKIPRNHEYICSKCGFDQQTDDPDLYYQEWQDRLREEQDDASFAAGEEEHRGGGER